LINLETVEIDFDDFSHFGTAGDQPDVPNSRVGKRPGLAAIHTPKSLAMISKLQQAILWIMTLAAVGADKETTPLRSMTIVLLGHRKTRSATARDQEHPKWGGDAGRLPARLAPGH